jgi:hypothetical protein
MIKSELVQRIASQNPHLYSRDIEKIVNAVLDEMARPCVAEIESNCGVSEPFQLSSEKHVKDAILVLVLSSQPQRRLLPFSRREKRCARGLIGKPCRQIDFTPRR